MKEEIKKYLEGLKKKFDENDNYYQAYKVINNKMILVGNASTKKELNELVDENLSEFVDENVEYVIKISYNISLKNYLKGPLSILCVINKLTDKGKLSKKDMKVNTVYYTEDELEDYKLKKNDYKLVANALLNDIIESNPLKIYTRKDIE